MKNTYYFCHPKKDVTKDTFDKFISSVHQIAGVGLQEQNENQVSIFYEKQSFRAELEYVQPEQDGHPYPAIKLSNEKVDNLSVNLLKGVSNTYQLRIYSPELRYYLPINLNLYDCISGIAPPRDAEIFEKLNVTPMFWLFQTYAYYVQNKVDNSIHFLNENLVKYYNDLGEPQPGPEFSYKVADSLEQFVPRYDAGIIPNDFYKYYQRSFKIMNYSGFNLQNPGRKVFIKPYVYDFKEDQQLFDPIVPVMSSIILMDKIRPGETLDMSIKRFLSEELKVANDYIGAIVDKKIEFDVDREGILTPRLITHIYIDKANLSDQQKQVARRQWSSPGTLESRK